VYEAIQRENQKAAKLRPSDARQLGNSGNSNISDIAPK
jgi:hypothetical protein